MSRYGSINDLPPHLREQAAAQLDPAAAFIKPVAIDNSALIDHAFATGVKDAIAKVETMVNTFRIKLAPMGPMTIKLGSAPPPKRRKYGNEPEVVDGHTFASKWEAQRYRELRNQVLLGQIHSLTLQPEFALEAWTTQGPVRIGAYIADFTYWRHVPNSKHVFVVEDCKSIATKRDKVYVWKRRHLEAQYGVTITEVERQRKRKS